MSQASSQLTSSSAAAARLEAETDPALAFPNAIHYNLSPSAAFEQQSSAAAADSEGDSDFRPSMLYCGNCGSSRYPHYEKFCKTCGTEQELYRPRKVQTKSQVKVGHLDTGRELADLLSSEEDVTPRALPSQKELVLPNDGPRVKANVFKRAQPY